MFESIELAPRDAILGLVEAFKEDPNPEKINLTVGVYKSEEGVTPVLDVVKEAESRLVKLGASKAYLPIPGHADYTSAVQNLLFGSRSEVVESSRATTIHSPGGTGALRVFGDFLNRTLPKVTIWLSAPTWPNHPSIFAAAGVTTKTYSYYNPETGGLDAKGMLAAMDEIPNGDCILLHACCHNPTGVDPTNEEWTQIIDKIQERGLFPLVDFAYQGFADGLEEDAFLVREFAKTGIEFAVCNSFSKNAGLYCERTGGLTIVSKDKTTANAVASQVKVTIRSNYSNPPAHGGAIVSTILGDGDLFASWIEEVAAMRNRIHGARADLVSKLKEHNAPRDYAFLSEQRGMFSYTGLTPEEVDKLREDYAIYIVRSGRINVAGVNAKNVDRLCEAIAKVTAK